MSETYREGTAYPYPYPYPYPYGVSLFFCVSFISLLRLTIIYELDKCNTMSD